MRLNSRLTMLAAALGTLSIEGQERIRITAREMPVTISSKSRLPRTKFNNNDPYSRECRRRAKRMK